MKVALYMRVSTEQQIENYSIPLQQERLKAYCKSKGWNGVLEYIDAGYSGSNLNRPALKQLQKDIKNKQIHAVVVYRLDRLSRSQRDTLYLIEELFLPNQIEFISLSETIDTSTAFGRAAIGVLSVFAQLERETIIDRLRGCHEKMVREEGLWAGSAAVHPYGYTRLARGELRVNEEERKHVIRIFEEYVKLKSFTKVQQTLAREGFPHLRNQRLIHLLQNRLYLGEVSFGGVWFKGSHEAIISDDLFHAVQQVRENHKGNSSGKAKNKVFTGKVFCRCCGEEYRAYIIRRKPQGEVIRYPYLMCKRHRHPSRYESKCPNRAIRREDFENEIFTRLQQIGSSGEIKWQQSIDYKKQIKHIDKKINKLLDYYMDDRLTKSVLETKLNDLNKQKEELLRKTEEQQENESEIQEFIKNGIPNLVECDLATQTEIIHLFIKKILVTEDSLQIIWNQ